MVVRDNNLYFSRHDQLLITTYGKEYLVVMSAAPIRSHAGEVMGVVLVFRDVTERRRLEEDLLKSRKLESLGVLAGGIAHDFNNLLMGISGNLTLAKMNLRDDPGKADELLEKAEEVTIRAQSLTKQLLTFSKGGAPVLRPENIAGIVEESSSFLLKGTRVRAEFSFPPDLWPVDIDAGQISQVVQNLTLNSVQAMPRGGVLRISAENLELGEDGGSGMFLNPGRYVRLIFSDEGVGISPDNLRRIFDPYFTTKESGSGLGLATTYSIIRKHNGHIGVKSAPDKGTRFSIYLPASTGKPEQVAKAASVDLQVGNLRVLVMDDEELIRETFGAMLQLLGFRVTTVRDGDEALQEFQRARLDDDPFGLVIMDLTVAGGRGGAETIGALLEQDSDLRVIVASGYSEDPVMADFRSYGFVGRLSKPFRLDDLKEVLAEVLEAGKNGA
jgi:signal transduction histidine kinase/ActR/RegA family two-component response regulator